MLIEDIKGLARAENLFHHARALHFSARTHRIFALMKYIHSDTGLGVTRASTCLQFLRSARGRGKTCILL